MKFSQVKGMAVVDLHDARKLGNLEDLLLDPQSRQIVELKVKFSLFGASTFIPKSWLKSIGPNAITVVFPPVTGSQNLNQNQAQQAQSSTTIYNANYDLNPNNPAPDYHETEPNNNLRSSKKMLCLSHLMGNQVVSDKGNLLGEIKDVLLADTDLAITGYEVSMGGFFSKTQRFPAVTEVHFGSKIVTVPEELVTQAR